MSTRQKAYWALATTSIVWGTTWVAMKIGVRHMPALQMAAIRQLLSGVGLITIFGIRTKSIPNFKQLLQLLGIGIFTFVIANGLATASLRYISSGLGALIAALYPLCVVLIEFFFFKHRYITWVSIIGIVLGIAGIVLVFYDNLFNTSLQVTPAAYWLGVLLATLSMLAWSVSTILNARTTIPVNPYMAIGWQMLFSGTLLYGWCWATHTAIPITQVPAMSWGAILYLVIFGSTLTMMAFIYTIRNLPTGIAALYAYINPIVAVFTGYLLLNEPLTANTLLGSAITIGGVYLVKSSMTKAAQQHQTTNS